MAEPRQPAAADGWPFGSQQQLLGGPNAAWATAAVSLSATVEFRPLHSVFINFVPIEALLHYSPIGLAVVSEND